MISVTKLSPKEWSDVSRAAHLICFQAEHDPSIDRIDFALLAMNEKDVPMGFITVRELSKTHLYWQFGGAFPGTKGTLFSYQAYQAGKEWCAAHYETICTYIENKNVIMLKFAMKLGFRIIGIKHSFGKTLVELFLNLKEVSV